MQGASDAGLIPMFYPDYQLVTLDDARERFETAWGRELDRERGLTVTEIVASALKGGVRGMYMMGENPFLSDPNVNKVRKALASLEFLAVQDIFLTETAEFADVILPASSYMEKEGTYTNTDRRVQIGRKVLESPGEAREDWRILCDVATRIGLPMEYDSPREIFDELVSLMPNYSGLSYDNLGEQGKLYPNPDPEHSDGTVVLFDEEFGTDDGKAHLVPAEWLPAKELPDEEFPFVLNTGRLLEHWHTGSMTRRSYALDTIAPEAHVYLNPDDAAEMGVAEGDFVRITSRRGSIELAAKLSHRDTPGTCFVPFHFREAAANVLTIDEIDPTGKIPEFKFCAVKVERAGPQEDSASRPACAKARADGQSKRRAESRSRGRGARRQVPRTQPDTQADRDPARARLAAARGARAALARRASPAVRDRGADLVLPPLPHGAAEKGRAGGVPGPQLLAARRRGAPRELRSRYGDDVEVEFHTVSCLGRCDVAPAVAVNERPAPATEAEKLVEEARSGEAAGGRPPQRERRANDPYEPDARDYRLLRAVLEGERTAEQIVSVLNESGLRGMGGAGFPTGKKWDLVANQEARPKYAICNADESEPGTFKDRQIMAEQPHLVLEGMLIGMAVTEAHEGWVFIRHEYGPEEEVLREEIERLRGLGVLDGSDLEIDVFVSPGGYILGEESALLECMEGHRGEPRNKPPFPGVYGLRGKPTLMNSVETFAHVPVILERGADWWNAQGVHDGTGLKFFAVSGHVERPDVYCVQMGTTARELIELAGGVSGALSCWRSNRAGPHRTSSVRTTSTSHSTSDRSRRPARCSALARLPSSPRAPTCWLRARTYCGSSATSRAGSASRAGWARTRRTRCSRRRSAPKTGRRT